MKLIILDYVSALSAAAFFLCLAPEARAQSKDVLTFHNDNARDGQYTNETILAPSNVNLGSFGKLWFLNADAHVDAEPLRTSGVLIPGAGFRNVVVLATENDTVYAYDADSTNLFWRVSLLDAGETASDDRNCSQVAPIIGITSTPVIDRQFGSNGTLFVVAMSRNASGTYYQRLHALDLATGAERLAPALISGSYPGTGANSSAGSVIFDPSQYKERAGLLLLGGVIYTAWASHCDINPYTGWIMGYDEHTLGQTNIINVTPNGNRGAIWMGNTAMAADSGSNIVFLDANGIFDGQTNASGFPVNNDYGNGFLKISTTNRALAVADYFETSNTVSQSGGDTDLGSGGAIVLPTMIDSNGAPRQLAVGAGKDENIYLVDLARMGKFNPGNNKAIYQEVTSLLGGAVFSMPAYFNSTLFYCANNDRLRAFPFIKARLGVTSATSASTAGATGATPSVSGSNNSNGIVWVINSPNNSSAILEAFSAANVSTEIYSSAQAAGNRDGFGGGNKYATPMISNGKVYAGSTNGVAVFGLLSQPAPVPVQTLSFLAQPSGTPPGGMIIPEARVQAEDINGQPVVGAQIILSLARGPGLLGGTLTRTTDAAGIAHFNDLSISQPGTNALAAMPSFGAATATAASEEFVIMLPPAITGVTVNNDGSVTLVYSAVSNGTYSVESTTDLFTGIWTNIVGSMTNAGGISVTFTDTNLPASTARFYRVVSP
ncbi:MAG TPA: pyrrolo-quinoline quinone [Verrucomicrobiae bacterium]|jgi:hypothetical protein